MTNPDGEGVAQGSAHGSMMHDSSWKYVAVRLAQRVADGHPSAKTVPNVEAVAND